MPRTWIITDTHFGHTELTELCGRPKDFSNRICMSLYRDLEASDTLIHLGDVCMGGDKNWHTLLGTIHKGPKILVRGNHDGQSDHWYMSHGWGLVVDEIVMHVGKKPILLTHIPRPPMQMYNHNVCGHLHNLRKLPEWWDEDYHKLIALEDIGYRPVLLRNVVERKDCKRW